MGQVIFRYKSDLNKLRNEFSYRTRNIKGSQLLQQYWTSFKVIVMIIRTANPWSTTLRQCRVVTISVELGQLDFCWLSFHRSLHAVVVWMCIKRISNALVCCYNYFTCNVALPRQLSVSSATTRHIPCKGINGKWKCNSAEVSNRLTNQCIHRTGC